MLLSLYIPNHSNDLFETIFLFVDKYLESVDQIS
jgi:hypothetical protein